MGIIVDIAHPHRQRLSWISTIIPAAGFKLVRSTGNHVQKSPTVDFWRRTITITLRLKTSFYIRSINQTSTRAKSSEFKRLVFTFRILE